MLANCSQQQPRQRALEVNHEEAVYICFSLWGRSSEVQYHRRGGGGSLVVPPSWLRRGGQHWPDNFVTVRIITDRREKQRLLLWQQFGSLTHPMSNIAGSKREEQTMYLLSSKDISQKCSPVAVACRVFKPSGTWWGSCKCIVVIFEVVVSYRSTWKGSREGSERELSWRR